jgi:hypothetical protein
MKSGRRWAEQVAHTGRREMHVIFWSGNLKGRDNLRNSNVDGRIILEWMLI